MHSFDLNFNIKTLDGRDSVAADAQGNPQPVTANLFLANILSHDWAQNSKEKFFILAKKLHNEESISADSKTVLEIIAAIERSGASALVAGQLITKLRGYLATQSTPEGRGQNEE
jgi:hypothetical protein